MDNVLLRLQFKKRENRTRSAKENQKERKWIKSERKKKIIFMKYNCQKCQ